MIRARVVATALLLLGVEREAERDRARQTLRGGDATGADAPAKLSE